MIIDMADTSNVDVPFIVSMSNADVKDVPTDADVQRNKTAVSGDTIKGTLTTRRDLYNQALDC